MTKIYIRLIIIIFLLNFLSCKALADEITKDSKPVKNLILMIGDGFSPEGATLARYVKGKNLNLDNILVGTIQTKSANSFITDSAAAATAFATGYKTNNRVIAIHPDTKKDLKNIIEAAKQKNISTGIVVTDKISGATPAAFSSHVENREMYEKIAEQQINSKIDVMFGGGSKYFLPISKNGTRTDNQDLLLIAKEYGINVIDKLEQLKTISETPVLGLFAKSKIKFAIDQKNDPNNLQPTLLQMSKKALELLNKNKNGFILMIEGSRIDHAASSNDPAAYAQEILSYDKTVGFVKEFVDNNPGTLMLSLADHGTGGVSVGREVNQVSDYIFNPEILSKVKHSAEYLYNFLMSGNDVDKMILEIGFDDFSDIEIQRIKNKTPNPSDNNQAVDEAMKIISERSRTGWTTLTHTGVDTNLYAYGNHSNQFYGNHDNTFIAKKIDELMNLGL